MPIFQRKQFKSTSEISTESKSQKAEFQPRFIFTSLQNLVIDLILLYDTHTCIHTFHLNTEDSVQVFVCIHYNILRIFQNFPGLTFFPNKKFFKKFILTPPLHTYKSNNNDSRWTVSLHVKLRNKYKMIKNDKTSKRRYRIISSLL